MRQEAPNLLDDELNPIHPMRYYGTGTNERLDALRQPTVAELKFEINSIELHIVLMGKRIYLFLFI